MTEPYCDCGCLPLTDGTCSLVLWNAKVDEMRAVMIAKGMLIPVPVELTVDPTYNPYKWLANTFPTQKELDRWLEETGYWVIQGALETIGKQPVVEIPPGLRNKEKK